MTMSMLPFVGGKWSNCAFLFRSVTPLCSCRSSGSVLPSRKDTNGYDVGVTRQIIPASAFTTAARSYYDVLNVSPSATQEQIKKSYIKLSKKYHPDLNNTKEAKEIFQDISEAYSVLSNINLRNTYNVQNGHVLYRERPRTYPGHARGARPPPPTGRSSYYNYDEFYRQHYAGYNRQTYERRTGVNLFTKQKLTPNEQRIKRFQIGCITTALSLSVLFMFLTEQYKQKRLRNIEESRKRYRYKRNREE